MDDKNNFLGKKQLFRVTKKESDKEKEDSNINVLNQSENSKRKNSGAQNNNSNNNLYSNDSNISIHYGNINWKDKNHTTIERIVNKVRSFNSNGNNCREYIVNVFFYEKPSRVMYKADDQNLSIDYIEKLHKAKIKEIFVELIQTEPESIKLKYPKEESIIQHRNYIRTLIEPGEELEIEKFPDMFSKFLKDFPNHWDMWENIVIEEICRKYTFPENVSYVYIYLYDNFKKMKDPKNIDQMRTKMRESPDLRKDLSYLSREMMSFYKYRQEKLKFSLSKNIKEIEWTEESSLLEIFLTSFIHTKLSHERIVDLTQHYIMCDNILIVLSSLKMNNNVTKLILNSNKIGEEGMWALGRLYNYNLKIVDLDLSVNILTDDCLKAFMLGLDGGNPSFALHHENMSMIPITKLNLSNNSQLTPESGQYIARIVERCINLKCLNISKNNIDVRGYNAILNMFSKLQSNENKQFKLETLIAYQTKVDNHTLEKFGDVLKHNNCPIKSLTLSDNKLNSTSAKTFLQSVASNKSLEELLLMNCDIGNELGDEIVNMIYNNKTLITLNLYNNRIDNSEIFKKILKVCSKNFPMISNNYRSSNLDKINYNPASSMLINQEPDKDVCDLFLTNEIPQDHNESNFDYTFGEKFNSDNNTHNKLPDNVIELDSTITVDRKLKNLDLSKNKCKLVIDNELLDIFNNIDLDSVDISQNFDFPTPDEDMSRRFKEVITMLQEKTKIIY